MLFFSKKQPVEQGGKHRKRFGALFSIEYAVVLAAVGVTVGYMLSTQGDTNEATLVNNAKTDILQAVEKARKTNGTFDDYSTFNNTDCYDKDIFPSSWRSSTQDEFTTPFADDGLTCGSADSATNKAGITTTGTGKFFTFAFSNVETSQCNNLVGALFEQMIEIQVEGTRIDGNNTMKTQCASADEVTVTLIHR
ncbi:hypothetical protein OCT63_18380 [Vibrio sp. RW]|uniref:hypothetical protein n=1 Tax=Vibrio sp. RW TaxID=2998833 RepID=UPI0022CD7075|nr:hypothetical protein [Vibrio sp. RW]MDA0146197.1 hypothetical protein [Vibrio sp. RW]